MIVGISKADLLADFLPLETDPWQRSHDQKSYVLDMETLAKMSDAVRCLLDKYAPEIVTTVESFAESVLYLPNSALGYNPEKEGVRPCDIKPRWVEVPLLYVLARLGYVPIRMIKKRING